MHNSRPQGLDWQNREVEEMRFIQDAIQEEPKIGNLITESFCGFAKALWGLPGPALKGTNEGTGIGIAKQIGHLRNA